MSGIVDIPLPGDAPPVVGEWFAAPDVYLGAPVPDHIAEAWRSWQAAEWRRARYRDTNRTHPPDERFSVRPPQGMCEIHRQMWRDYRDMHFDPRSGNRWPGHPGSPFVVVGHDIAEVREQRRVEWDEKASEQMQLIERICLSGRSPQCDRGHPGDAPDRREDQS